MSRLVIETHRPAWEKAMEFARVATSGFADAATVARRLESCRSCDKIDRAEDGREYCGACDCGRWPLARLDRKLGFLELPCPLGRPGFHNEGAAPGEFKPCSSCNQPVKVLTPIEVGEAAIIVVAMPGEPVDRRPWRVEARRGEVYDLVRSRRLGLAWLRKLGRPERAMVSRTAIGRPGDDTVSYQGAGAAPVPGSP